MLVSTLPSRRTWIDTRLQDETQDNLVQAFKSIEINNNDLPLHPGYGLSRKQVALRTNFFPVIFPKGPFYEYQISITPSVSSNLMKWRIIQLAEDTLLWQSNLAGYAIHDHSSRLIACQHLSETLTVSILWYPKNKHPPTPGSSLPPEYTITFDFVRELEMDSLEK